MSFERASSRDKVNTWVLSPAGVTFFALSLVVLVVLAKADWDPLALARLGDRFQLGLPAGSEGYDGQFVYYIARHPNPTEVAPLLDVPAYRYQRILLPLLARVLALGSPTVIPWTLAAIGVLSHVFGTALLSSLLESWGTSRWYGLTYGLWVGFTLAVRLDLPEPLAYGLVVAAILSILKGRERLGWVLFGLALFAKEVTALFLAGYGLDLIRQKRWRGLAGFTLVAGIPFLLFQGWLWSIFGQPGLGSGGANATPFEWLPFMGLLRIGFYSPELLLATVVVFTPAVVVPAALGIWVGVRNWLKGRLELMGAVLLTNAIIIPFLPFSTFREPGGLLRFACGLILAVILYSGRMRIKRSLDYGLLLLVLNVFLLK